MRGEDLAAAEAIDAAWRRFPDDAQVVSVARRLAFRMATQALRNNDMDEVVRWSYRAAEYEPRDWRPHYQIGRALERSDRLDEAEHAYRRSLDRRRQPRVELALADLLVKQSRFSLAVPLYESVLSSEGRSADVLVGYGTALWQMGRGRDALLAFEEALMRSPGDATARQMVQRLRRERRIEEQYDIHHQGSFTTSFERSPEQWEVKNKLLRVLQ